MKYKCLVLDHDDTVVNSTAIIHYPAFAHALKHLRPNFELSLEDYLQYNFHPGFTSFCEDILGFSKQEQDYQTENWLAYVDSHIPTVYKGISDILWKFKEMGGYICVVSHSMKDNILRDYKENNLPTPDMVFGWDLLPTQRKPSTYSLEMIKKELNIDYSDMLMIDDLKPGKIMAENMGVSFIAAGWSHSIDEIEKEMKSNNGVYCQTVEELNEYIF